MSVAPFPLDHPLTVRRFFDQLQPRALLLVETELWPGVLACAHERRVPVALLSGRLSDDRANAYRRVAALWRPVIRPITVAAMQSATYADRIAELGLDRGRISITGNIKYDAVPTASSPKERAALRAQLGIAPDAPVLVFGSTREGDETLAARCYAYLRKHIPGLRLIVAPRHLDRLEAAQSALSEFPQLRRSALPAGMVGGDPVLILDTHGELGSIYGVAQIAVVCGSFYPGVNGHNPIEPAAQGVAAVFGTYMRNFADIAAQLLDGCGAVQVDSPESLPEFLATLLADAPGRTAIGESGARVVHSNQGAIQRTLDAVAPMIEGVLGRE